MNSNIIITEVVRADKHPAPILMETTAALNDKNGASLFPRWGRVVVVSHDIAHTGGNIYQRWIYVVPWQRWHPVPNPPEGDDAVIGYYETEGSPSERRPVKRDGRIPEDRVTEGYCGCEWDPNLPSGWPTR